MEEKQKRKATNKYGVRITNKYLSFFIMIQPRKILQ